MPSVSYCWQVASSHIAQQVEHDGGMLRGAETAARQRYGPR
jgi:hypothetical protein